MEISAQTFFFRSQILDCIIRTLYLMSLFYKLTRQKLLGFAPACSGYYISLSDLRNMSGFKKEKKKFIENVSWLVIAKSVPSVANIVEMIVLTRVLGLEIFGLLTLVVAYVKIISSLLDFRVWESVVKYVGEFMEKREIDRALSMIKFSYIVDAITGLLAFAVCLLLANLANDMFIKSPEGFDLILIFSLSLLFATINSTSEALFRVFDRFKTIVFVQSAKSVFKLGLVLVALYLDYGIKGVLVAYIAVSLFEFVLTQVAVRRMLKEKGLGSWFSSRLTTLSDKLKEIMWFLFNTSFNATISIANEGKVAVLILGHFFGSGSVGIYKVARVVIRVINRAVDPLHEAIFPRLVSFSTSGLHKTIGEIIRFAVKSLLKLAIPFVVVVLLFAEQIIDIIFGSQYLASSDTMRVLALATLFNGSIFWFRSLLLAVGKPGLRTVVSVFKISSYIILLLALVPRHSYFGAAVAYLIVEFLHFLVAIYLGHRFSRGNWA